MSKLPVVFAVLMMFSVPAFAKHPEGKSEEHGGPNQGHIPKHGPARVQTPQPKASEAHNYHDAAGHPNTPHVHSDGKWIGHASGPKDMHYHLDHPWEHGHFT